MEGWDARNLAFAHPEMFAALVPIAEFIDQVLIIEQCKIASIPIRILSGLMNDVVDVNYSVSIYKRLKFCNSNIKLTIFDDLGHESCT